MNSEDAKIKDAFLVYCPNDREHKAKHLFIVLELSSGLIAQSGFGFV
jgi:hypothetical protein